MHATGFGSHLSAGGVSSSLRDPSNCDVSTSSQGGTGAGKDSVGGGIGTDHRHLKSARHFMEWIYKAEAHLDNKGDTAIKKCCEALQKSLLSIHTLLNQVLPTK